MPLYVASLGGAACRQAEPPQYLYQLTHRRINASDQARDSRYR
jgi:hypothetical protein